MKFLAVILSSLMLVSCGGGGDGITSNPIGGSTVPSTAVPLPGKLSVVSGDDATRYIVFNPNQSSSPASNGAFSTAVAKDVPTYTYAISDNGGKVYASVNTNADSSVTIDAQSTAEALVLLNPLLIPGAVSERTVVVNLAKADVAVKTLASVIDNVYASSADPLNDLKISDALADAVISVLTSWQAANANSPNPAMAHAAPLWLPAPVRLAAGGSPQLQTWNNGEMIALTMLNGTGSNLKLEPTRFPTRIGTVTTNVDWVARVVELDQTKISPSQLNLPFSSIDGFIKPGGFDEKFVVNGAVASGGLGWATDPLGTVKSLFVEKLVPDNGIALPHDGVYAVVALSGSPSGDLTELSTVVGSSWQTKLFAEASALNICRAASDLFGVATSFPGADVMEAAAPLFAAECEAIRATIASNPAQVTKEFAAAQAAELFGKISMNYGAKAFKSISKIHLTSLTTFFSKTVSKKVMGAIQAAPSILSGGISFTTRLGDFYFKVTSRESGYADLRTPSVTPVCTAGEVLSGGVCVTAPPITCTLPQVLTNGQCLVPTLASQTITFNTPGNQTIGVETPALSASSTGGGLVSFTSITPSVCAVSGAALTLVAAGSCTINADQAGGAMYAAAPTVSRTFTVLPATSTLAPQTITFNLPGSQTIGVTPPTLSASSTSGLMVTLSSSTQSVCKVSSRTLTLIAAGSCTIEATQGGSPNYLAAATVTRTFTVSAAARIPQTITFTPVANVKIGGALPSFSVTSTSNLVPTLSSSTPSVCSVGAVTITILAPGICTVSADQSGDSVYAPAARVTQSFIVMAGTPDLRPNYGIYGTSISGVYSFPFTVENIGNAPSEVSTTLVRLTDPNSSIISEVLLPTQAISTGYGTSLTFNHTIDNKGGVYKGRYKITIIVDYKSETSQLPADKQNDSVDIFWTF